MQDARVRCNKLIRSLLTKVFGSLFEAHNEPGNKITMSVVIYTCITRGYDDSLARPAPQTTAVNYKCFTDSRKLRAPGWDRVPIVKPPDIKRSDLINRYYKFFPHVLMPDIGVSIYIDGNISVIGDLTPLIDQFTVSEMPFACLVHTQRKTVWQEAEACRKLGKFKGHDLEKLQSQLAFYSTVGFPVDTPLVAATILIRRHDSVPMMHAMNLWWSHILTFTARDQLSLPYVLWKSQLPFMTFDFDVLGDNDYVSRRPHKLVTASRVRQRAAAISRKLFGLGKKTQRRSG